MNSKLLAEYMNNAEVRSITNLGTNERGEMHVMILYIDGSYYDFYEAVKKEDK